jgi:dienelactone hydrolase
LLRRGVLVIGGSEGGYSPYLATLLASRGYASLALAYFKEPGLPQTLKDIPLEYFAKALRWLAAQPGVDSKRVVLLGASRGGEGALLIGSTYLDLVHGVIAASPIDQVAGAYPGPGDAWTLGGKPVPLGPIAVEKIGGPVLAFAGGKDEIWDSKDSVARIVARARAHGREDIVGVVYLRAGHGVVLVPNAPTAGTIETAPGTYVELGGTTEDNLRAHADSWARILRFLATLGK